MHNSAACTAERSRGLALRPDGQSTGAVEISSAARARLGVCQRSRESAGGRCPPDAPDSRASAGKRSYCPLKERRTRSAASTPSSNVPSGRRTKVAACAVDSPEGSGFERKRELQHGPRRRWKLADPRSRGYAGRLRWATQATISNHHTTTSSTTPRPLLPPPRPTFSLRTTTTPPPHGRLLPRIRSPSHWQPRLCDVAIPACTARP